MSYYISAYIISSILSLGPHSLKYLLLAFYRKSLLIPVLDNSFLKEQNYILKLISYILSERDIPSISQYLKTPSNTKWLILSKRILFYIKYDIFTYRESVILYLL